MILETENLKIQNSECSNALSLDPHETKKAVLIKTTGKEKCEDSEDENFFKNVFLKMIAMLFDFDEADEKAVKVESIEHSRTSTGILLRKMML